MEAQDAQLNEEKREGEGDRDGTAAARAERACDDDSGGGRQDEDTRLRAERHGNVGSEWPPVQGPQMGGRFLWAFEHGGIHALRPTGRLAYPEVVAPAP